MPNPDIAYLWGFGVGVVLTHLVILRAPRYRRFVLKLPILKSARK